MIARRCAPLLALALSAAPGTVAAQAIVAPTPPGVATDGAAEGVAAASPCDPNDPMPVQPIEPAVVPPPLPPNVIPIPNACATGAARELVGAPRGTVRIRGTATVVGQPLYVVDGVRVAGRNPLNDLPPTEIESITVLRDAAGIAPYGPEGRNGVVVITTRGAAAPR